MSRIAVIIPAYRVSKSIADVVRGVPDRVEKIYVVDDACPQNSGTVAREAADKRVDVITRPANGGVGAAVKTGYAQALEDGMDIIVKMDGDGQMDPDYLDSLIAPLENGTADYVKGNRFKDFSALSAMPLVRLFGNSVLSFMVKAASGYWNLMDPTNGYTAIRREELEKLSLELIANRFFFESDMLIHLNIHGTVASDVAIPARYTNAGSSLSVIRVLPDFLLRIAGGLTRRLFLKYYVHDFNMASVYMMLGLPMFIFGTWFGISEWLGSVASGVPATTGSIMLAVLPIILGFQMLLHAIQIDIQSVPKRPGSGNGTP